MARKNAPPDKDGTLPLFPIRSLRVHALPINRRSSYAAYQVPCSYRKVSPWQDLHWRGQSSLEFVMVVGAMVFFFILLLAGIAEQQGTRAAQERAFLVKDLAISVQQEFILAAGARDGYERTFALPQTLINQDYNISLVSNVVYVATADGKHSLALPVPAVNGTLMKGDNKIRKHNGGVFVNT